MSIAEARAIALKAHPGEITDEELEREAAELVFDIRSTSRVADHARSWR